MKVADLGTNPTGNEPEIAEAVDALRRGEIVAYATETVFGLACDARSRDACLRLRELKGRAETHTLPVQVFDSAPPYWPWPLPDMALGLFSAFAPGPITVVVPGGGGLAGDVVAHDGTVAIRVPSHPVARAVLRSFGGPVACPSANPTGHGPACDAVSVTAYFPEGVVRVLAGGPAPSGVASTIVAVCGDAVRILRPGAIAEKEVTAWLEEFMRTR